jgi:hypothetical protein
VDHRFSLPLADGRDETAGRGRKSRCPNGLRFFAGSRQGSIFRCRGGRQGNGREAAGRSDKGIFYFIIDNIAKAGYIGAVGDRASRRMGHGRGRRRIPGRPRPAAVAQPLSEGPVRQPRRPAQEGPAGIAAGGAERKNDGQQRWAPAPRHQARGDRGPARRPVGRCRPQRDEAFDRHAAGDRKEGGAAARPRCRGAAAHPLGRGDRRQPDGPAAPHDPRRTRRRRRRVARHPLPIAYDIYTSRGIAGNPLSAGRAEGRECRSATMCEYPLPRAALAGGGSARRSGRARPGPAPEVRGGSSSIAAQAA